MGKGDPLSELLPHTHIYMYMYIYIQTNMHIHTHAIAHAHTGLLSQQEQERAGEGDPLSELLSLWGMPFLPNLMNTVVFLVETSQVTAVLFVNYKGMYTHFCVCMCVFVYEQSRLPRGIS